MSGPEPWSRSPSGCRRCLGHGGSGRHRCVAVARRGRAVGCSRRRLVAHWSGSSENGGAPASPESDERCRRVRWEDRALKPMADDSTVNIRAGGPARLVASVGAPRPPQRAVRRARRLGCSPAMRCGARSTGSSTIRPSPRRSANRASDSQTRRGGGASAAADASMTGSSGRLTVSCPAAGEEPRAPSLAAVLRELGGCRAWGRRRSGETRRSGKPRRPESLSSVTRMRRSRSCRPARGG